METQPSTSPQTPIIDRLVGKNTASSPDQASRFHATEEVMISTQRVVSTRYRIYVLLIILVLGYFVYNYLRPVYDLHQNTAAELTTVALKVKSFDATKLSYEANKRLQQTVEQNEAQVISCVNNNQGCQELPDAIKQKFSIARGYLLLGALSSPKMTIDEKLLLANINEYLLRQSWSTTSSQTNGVLRSLQIGEPTQFRSHLWYVPLELTINFSNKDGLLSFIDNVERKIVPDAAYRVFYVIEKITYNIVDYTQPQDATVIMYAYYYQ